MVQQMAVMQRQITQLMDLLATTQQHNLALATQVRPGLGTHAMAPTHPGVQGCHSVAPVSEERLACAQAGGCLTVQAGWPGIDFSSIHACSKHQPP